MKTVEVKKDLFLEMCEYEDLDCFGITNNCVGKYFDVTSAVIDKLFRVKTKIKFLDSEIFNWVIENTEYFSFTHYYTDDDDWVYIRGWFVNEIDAIAFKMRFG